MTDPIKAKIIELVPDILGVGSKRDGHRIISVPVQRKITLADVLRAIEKELGAGFAVFQGGQIWMGGKYTMFIWNLSADYDGQTDEVKEFIGKLLGV